MLLVAAGHVFWAKRSMRVELTSQALAVRGDLFGPTLPLAKLDPDGARAVDPETDPQARIAGRIWGGGFAGYRSGWFRLADGSKAQVFLRDGEGTVLVPTRQGYSLLLSMPDPDAFLRTLKQRFSRSRD